MLLSDKNKKASSNLFNRLALIIFIAPEERYIEYGNLYRTIM
jgi:hypothetical protein